MNELQAAEVRRRIAKAKWLSENDYIGRNMGDISFDNPISARRIECSRQARRERARKLRQGDPYAR